MGKSMSVNLRHHFDLAVQQSQEARGRGDLKSAWQLLERAHVIGQAWIAPHLRSHWAMLKLGWFARDGGEVVGQVLRLALVIPGTWLGRLPLGNTGGSNVNPFRPMPLPEDLRQLLAEN